jgi:hypothetical protein
LERFDSIFFFFRQVGVRRASFVSLSRLFLTAPADLLAREFSEVELSEMTSWLLAAAGVASSSSEMPGDPDEHVRALATMCAQATYEVVQAAMQIAQQQSSSTPATLFGLRLPGPSSAAALDANRDLMLSSALQQKREKERRR